MNASPLNYSDVGYDVDGPAGPRRRRDLERRQLRHPPGAQRKYDAQFPSTDAALQAGARTAPRADACPGNRRWIQLVFDAWLLMPRGAVSMVDARDAMLAADLMRFGGANQALLWNAFAARGLGDGRPRRGHDPDPRPSFSSPYATEGTLTFAPPDTGGGPVDAQLFVGRYEARAVPVADTDPATSLGASVDLVPGSYELIVRAPGFGTHRSSATVAGQTRAIPALPAQPRFERTGATASGPGVNLASLIDDTEATNWASLGAPVAGQRGDGAAGAGPWPPDPARAGQCAAAAAERATRGIRRRAGSRRCASFEILTCERPQDATAPTRTTA